MGYIYKICNDINTKIYIGMTTRSLELRWKEHTQYDINDDWNIHRAMRKYGVDHFWIELVEECIDKELPEKEKYWIKYYNSCKKGYNMTLGGECASEQIKIPIYQYTLNGKYIRSYNSISDAMRYLQIDTTANIVSCAKGKILSVYGYIWSYQKYDCVDPVVNKSINLARYYKYVFYKEGQKFGPYNLQEAKDFLQIKSSNHISNVLRGKAMTVKRYQIQNIDWNNLVLTMVYKSIIEHHYSSHHQWPNVSIPVIQLDKQDNIINQYDSVAEAERIFGNGSKGHISQVCKGKRKTAYGYKWKYLSNN